MNGGSKVSMDSLNKNKVVNSMRRKVVDCTEDGEDMYNFRPRQKCFILRKILHFLHCEVDSQKKVKINRVAPFRMERLRQFQQRQALENKTHIPSCAHCEILVIFVA